MQQTTTLIYCAVVPAHGYLVMLYCAVVSVLCCKASCVDAPKWYQLVKLTSAKDLTIALQLLHFGGMD